MQDGKKLKKPSHFSIVRSADLCYTFTKAFYKIFLKKGAPMENKLFVTYEQFGAVGDGKADDIEAIAKAHAYANEHRLPVKAKDDATSYIGGKDVAVIIKTSTDFGKAHFIIDDRECENHRVHIFRVTSDFSYYPITIEKIDQGQKTIDIPHEGNIFVKVKNENKRVYIRYGANQNNGNALLDYFTVDKDGNIGTLMAWQFDEGEVYR